MRILLVGDSHMVGFFGEKLENKLRSQGHDVVRLAKGGWSATTFLTSRGQDELDRLDGWFDLALLELGTNDAANLDSVPLEKAAANILTLTRKLPTARVVWVGPPSFDATIARTLYPAFASYDLNSRARDLWLAVSPQIASIDSRPSTQQYAKRDDVHFGPKGSEAWASSVVDQLDKLGRSSTVAAVVIVGIAVLLAALS